MQIFRRREDLDLLDDLLEREKSAVLTGNFVALDRLVKEKERLMAVLKPVANSKDMAALRRKAKRNQAILQAAGQGIRSVSLMLSNQNKNNHTLQTYDNQGRHRTQHTSGQHIERRA